MCTSSDGMEHGKVTWMRSSQYKNDLAVPTNAHHRCDWFVACTEACGDIKDSHNLHTPSDVISHNLIHHQQIKLCVCLLRR